MKRDAPGSTSNLQVSCNRPRHLWSTSLCGSRHPGLIQGTMNKSFHQGYGNHALLGEVPSFTGHVYTSSVRIWHRSSAPETVAISRAKGSMRVAGSNLSERNPSFLPLFTTLQINMAPQNHWVSLRTKGLLHWVNVQCPVHESAGVYQSVSSFALPWPSGLFSPSIAQHRLVIGEASVHAAKGGAV